MADGEKKAKINAKAFVRDFVSGASYNALIEKYQFNASQLLTRIVQTLRKNCRERLSVDSANLRNGV